MERRSNHNREANRFGRTKAIWVIVALSIILAIVGPICWPDHVAAPWLVWTGPILFALAALFATAAQRGNSFAVAGLMLLAGLDLAAYGMSYAVYPQTATFEQYVAAIPGPPSSAGQRVALDLVAANQSGLHAGNQLLLAGRPRIDGYAGSRTGARTARLSTDGRH